MYILHIHTCKYIYIYIHIYIYILVHKYLCVRGLHVCTIPAADALNTLASTLPLFSTGRTDVVIRHCQIAVQITYMFDFKLLTPSEH